MPFCAQTTGSTVAAVPPPATGRSAHASSAAAVSWLLTVEDERVVRAKVDVLRAARRRRMDVQDAVRRGDLEPAGGQRVELAVPGDEDDVAAGRREQAADDAADGSGPDDDVAHDAQVTRTASGRRGRASDRKGVRGGGLPAGFLTVECHNVHYRRTPISELATRDRAPGSTRRARSTLHE